MFEAVRQIVENRLLSIGGGSYATVEGDTLRSIVSKNPKARDVGYLKSINPTYTTFDNDLLILLGSNNTDENAGWNISGFPDGFLSSTRVSTGGTVGTILTSLALHNGGDNSVTAPFNQFLRVNTSDRLASLPDKIDSWSTSINGESDLGFTTQRVGDYYMRITPRNRATSSFPADSLSVGRSDGFNPSLESVFIPPRIWTISDRAFPLFIEGRQFTQPVNSKFSILMIQDAASVGREFGNVKNARRHSGTVRIRLYAPHGTGTKVIRDMADQFDEVLSYTAGDSNTGSGGTLFMKAGSLKQVSENTDGFLEYNLDYIYDYYTS